MLTSQKKELPLQILRTFLKEHNHEGGNSHSCLRKMAWHFFRLYCSDEQTQRNVAAFFTEGDRFADNLPFPEQEANFVEPLQRYIQQIEHLDTPIAGEKDPVSRFYSDLLTLLAEECRQESLALPTSPSPNAANQKKTKPGPNGFFSTPALVADFMLDLLQPETGNIVYDPVAGTCDLLVEASRRNTALKLVGNEIDPEVALLGAMNLTLHGIDISRFSRQNALLEEVLQPKKKKSLPKKKQPSSQLDMFSFIEWEEEPAIPSQAADIILAHLPFHTHASATQGFHKPPESFATQYDTYFLQQFMHDLKKEGKGHCALILERSVLDGEVKIARGMRQKLFREFNIQLIMALPPKIFGEFSNATTCLLFFSNESPTGKTLHYVWPDDEIKVITPEFFAPIKAIWERRQIYLEGKEQLPEGERYQYLWIEPYDDLHYEESLSQDPGYTPSKNFYKLFRPRPIRIDPLPPPKTLITDILTQTTTLHQAASKFLELLEQGEQDL